MPRFQEELREHLRTDGEIYKTIRESGDLGGDLEEKLKAAVEKFQGQLRRTGRPQRAQGSASRKHTPALWLAITRRQSVTSSSPRLPSLDSSECAPGLVLATQNRGSVTWRSTSGRSPGQYQAPDPLGTEHAQDHEGDGARRFKARLRRAQARIEAMRPYADRMLELMVGTARPAHRSRGLPPSSGGRSGRQRSWA